MRKDDLESALRWVKSELGEACKNKSYKKETLIYNLIDRVNAALGEGAYKTDRSRQGAK